MLSLVNPTKEELNDFLITKKQTSFLQSFEWGEFQKKYGFPVKRFLIQKEKKTLAGITLIQKKIGFNYSYLYSPHGPIFKEALNEQEKEKVFLFFISELKEKNIFLRFEPDKNLSFLKKPLFQKTINLQPAKSIFLNLNLTEEKLLNNMHQKTRYNLRLAQKKGVAIFESNQDNLNDFIHLLKETSQRDNFNLHPLNYYQTMIRSINNEIKEKELAIKLLYARYNKKIIATGLFSFFGDTATYLHGASSNKSREVMAPYLLQWEAIKIAQKNHFSFYDFYGIDEKKWPGVTRFKKGFGGEIINLPGTFDLVFNQTFYLGYKLIRKINRLKF